MEKSYECVVATHIGPESCGAAREGGAEAFDRGTCGPGIQPRKNIPPGRRRCRRKRKAPSWAPTARGAQELRAVRDPVHVRKHLVREPGDPRSAQGSVALGRIGKSKDARR